MDFLFFLILSLICSYYNYPTKKAMNFTPTHFTRKQQQQQQLARFEQVCVICVYPNKFPTHTTALRTPAWRAHASPTPHPWSEWLLLIQEVVVVVAVVVVVRLYDGTKPVLMRDVRDVHGVDDFKTET